MPHVIDPHKHPGHLTRALQGALFVAAAEHMLQTSPLQLIGNDECRI